MTEFKLTTPVALFVFNRPETTAKVFASIHEAKPTKLLIVADGPRKNRSSDVENCEQVRSLLATIDWDCEVLRNYSEENLGCRGRVSSGLDWVFNTVEEAIILEDDCLPHPTFYRFCSEMLEKYRDDTRIMHIGGNNFQPVNFDTKFSYYFSYFNHIWGWASWRRAWQYYDVDMKLWAELGETNWLGTIFGCQRYIKFWQDYIDRVARGEVDTWDCQWTFACWAQHGFSILPRVTMVSNIGFSGEATHTVNFQHPFANIVTNAIEFPLHHPPHMVRDAKADRDTQELLFSPGVETRVRNKLTRIFNNYRSTAVDTKKDHQVN